MNPRQPLDQLLPFHLFDREADVRIVQRRLPHWSQPGAICFITWRAHDSMPQAVLDKWFSDRAHWLRAHGIEPGEPNWRQRLAKLGGQLASDFLDRFWNRWHDALDACGGTCVLR